MVKSFAKDYIDIMSEVKKFGLDIEFEERASTIVLFGDQSSGTSSVFQRLVDGLPVPRGANKCTRAPFEVRMLESDTPSRIISLRFVEDRYNSRISKVEEFANITYSTKREIEEKLRKAQRCVLNPNTFLQAHDETELEFLDDDELNFTKNVVCVTISGPNEMNNLTMVDLPGIVRTNEEQEHFVFELVREYIYNDSAILVPIFSAVQDITTQGVRRLAREADPTGERTVGVLTKIDKADDDDKQLHKDLVALVKGDGDQRIPNGCYVVRNPNTGIGSGRSDRSERSEAYEDPNRLEQETINQLKKIKPWESVPSDRYGIQNLNMKLGELQRNMHSQTWPRIRPLLENRKNQIAEKLRNLPPELTGSPIIHFLKLIGTYDKLFTTHANAENVDHRLYRGQQWNFGEFDQALLYTRPRYHLSFENGSVNRAFDPIKPGSLQNRAWSEKSLTNLKINKWSDMFDDEVEYTWDSDKLCETVQTSQGGQIVGYFPYKAVVEIVRIHQQEWKDISIELLNENFKWVRTFNEELIGDIFKEFPNAIDEIKRILLNLLNECKEETSKHLKDLHDMENISASRALYVTDEASVLKKQAKYYAKYRMLCTEEDYSQEMKKILHLTKRLYEKMYDQTFTQTEFDNLKSDLVRKITDLDKSYASAELIHDIEAVTRRPGETPSSTASTSMFAAIKNLYSNKMSRLAPMSARSQGNGSVLRNTINEHALLAATGALAYWKMSHTKFREIVPRIVEFYLVHQFAKRLGMYLRAHFGLLGPGVEKSEKSSQESSINLNDMLVENQEIANNRKEWSEQIEALNNVLEKVQKASVKTRTYS